MTTVTPSTKSAFACIRCSERKVRCNRRIPCETCIRYNVECVFRPPKVSRRKRRIAKDILVEARLKGYEAVLREKGIDPNQVVGSSEAEYGQNVTHLETSGTVWQLPAPNSITSGPQSTIFKPQLLHKQKGTALVDNSLWSRVAEEIQEAEYASDQDSASDASEDEMFSDDFAYVLGWKTSQTYSSHPCAEIKLRLWDIFKENVNPLTKLIHVPSLDSAIKKAIADIDRIPRGFEALMFAIYSMAVLSLTDAECRERLGEAREKLLSQYVNGTKAALSRAKFMSSTSIVILQALVLHILSIRDDYEPRAVWSLTGVAMRIAEGMGMRLDGTLLGLPPFETEIYRRIWWQLKMHDFRAAELCGQAKLRDFELDDTTPKKPANVNDRDLYPGMPQAVMESDRPTEMLWIMFRSDLASFAATQKVRMRKLGKTVLSSEELSAMDDLQLKDSSLQKMEDMLETKHFRFCDPSQPLQFMTLLGGRLSMNLARFLLHHPRRWASLDHVPESEQKLVWDTVIQLLEQYKMMQSSPQLQRFAWNIPYFIQWQAVIHILDTLRADPLHQDAAKAWGLIDALYEQNHDLMLSIKRPILVAVGNLCLKAFNARTSALTNQAKSLPNPPDYITQLREQRQAAKTRRSALNAKKEGQKSPNSTINNTTDPSSTQQPANPNLPSTDPLSIEAQTHAPHHAQSTPQNSDDAFWLSETTLSSENNLFSTSGADADTMNIDIMNTDAILLGQEEYQTLDAAGGGVIDWTQWDAWLGNKSGF